MPRFAFGSNQADLLIFSAANKPEFRNAFVNAHIDFQLKRTRDGNSSRRLQAFWVEVVPDGEPAYFAPVIYSRAASPKNRVTEFCVLEMNTAMDAWRATITDAFWRIANETLDRIAAKRIAKARFVKVED